jgi:hypothetical protein
MNDCSTTTTTSSTASTITNGNFIHRVYLKKLTPSYSIILL